MLSEGYLIIPDPNDIYYRVSSKVDYTRLQVNTFWYGITPKHHFS